MSESPPRKREVRTAAAPAPIGGYSQGIEAGGLLFTSGQGPADPRTGEVPAGIAAQTEATIDNLAAILEAAGCGLDDVVKATVHLADLDDFAAFDAAYRARFAEPRPVRTTVQSGLMGILVEIDVVAIPPR
jgi:2-iminobutanoate/2-iminopropanoate deaminase